MAEGRQFRIPRFRGDFLVATGLRPSGARPGADERRFVASADPRLTFASTHRDMSRKPSAPALASTRALRPHLLLKTLPLVSQRAVCAGPVSGSFVCSACQRRLQRVWGLGRPGKLGLTALILFAGVAGFGASLLHDPPGAGIA
jgi:hypothetical protein